MPRKKAKNQEPKPNVERSAIHQIGELVEVEDESPKDIKGVLEKKKAALEAAHSKELSEIDEIVKLAKTGDHKLNSVWQKYPHMRSEDFKSIWYGAGGKA